MSLYTKRSGKRAYYYFQSGRGKHSYLGPEGKIDPAGVRDAAEYVKGRISEYQKVLLQLLDFLPEKERSRVIRELKLQEGLVRTEVSSPTRQEVTRERIQRIEVENSLLQNGILEKTERVVKVSKTALRKYLDAYFEKNRDTKNPADLLAVLYGDIDNHEITDLEVIAEGTQSFAGKLTVTFDPDQLIEFFNQGAIGELISYPLPSPASEEGSPDLHDVQFMATKLEKSILRMHVIPMPWGKFVQNVDKLTGVYLIRPGWGRKAKHLVYRGVELI